MIRSRKDAIEYLRPIADNSSLVNFQKALQIAIEAMEQLEAKEDADGQQADS